MNKHNGDPVRTFVTRGGKEARGSPSLKISEYESFAFTKCDQFKDLKSTKKSDGHEKRNLAAAPIHHPCGTMRGMYQSTPEQIAYCASRGVIHGGKPDHVVSAVSAAKRIGVSQKVFLAAAKKGEIPLSIMRIGRRFFVRSSELERWLNPSPTPAADCSDLF